MPDLELRTPEDVSRTAQVFFGSRFEQDSPRVIHSTAVWRQGARLVTILINRWAPKSAHDRFVLDLCRARSDAIVTSGRNLRSEPKLTHELPEAFRDWRADRLRKNELPVNVILTRGQDLDPEHRLFETGKTIVYTSASELSLKDNGGIEVVVDREASLRSAIDHLRTVGLETILIEVGPTTSRSLYEPPVAVNELVLSTYEEELDPRARGTAIPETILDTFHPARPAYRTTSASGRWSFSRYLE